MHTLAVTAFLFVMAVLFAGFEIEGEGKYGWAEKFPTWYRVNGFIPKLYTWFTNKTLTGYHAALFFIPILIFFYPMVSAGHVTWHGTFAAMATYFAWVTVWDFSWFVLNPHYGLANFRRDKVWWFSHEPWVAGRMPLGYALSWVCAIALSALSGWLDGGIWHSVSLQLQQFGWYLVGLFLLATAGKPVFHRYYHRMREHDERNQAGIFHADVDS